MKIILELEKNTTKEEANDILDEIRSCMEEDYAEIINYRLN